MSFHTTMMATTARATLKMIHLAFWNLSCMYMSPAYTGTALSSLFENGFVKGIIPKKKLDISKYVAYTLHFVM